ncbi:hypothetical protein HOY82DRAFT_564232 [Tuber indicum]|nr:hypothetical protein HOY82DRAFT_564232 [Tuber indicum]
MPCSSCRYPALSLAFLLFPEVHCFLHSVKTPVLPHSNLSFIILGPEIEIEHRMLLWLLRKTLSGRGLVSSVGFTVQI